MRMCSTVEGFLFVDTWRADDKLPGRLCNWRKDCDRSKGQAAPGLGEPSMTGVEFGVPLDNASKAKMLIAEGKTFP